MCISLQSPPVNVSINPRETPPKHGLGNKLRAVAASEFVIVLRNNSKTEILLIHNLEKLKIRSSKFRTPQTHSMITNGKNISMYESGLPRSAFNRNAFSSFAIRLFAYGSTSHTCPRCSPPLPMLPTPARRRSSSSAGGGRSNTAAFHVRQVRSDMASPAPSLPLVVATRLCAPRVRVGGPVSHDGILHVFCDRQYRARSWHMSLGNHGRPRHRSTPQTRPHHPAPQCRDAIRSWVVETALSA